MANTTQTHAQLASRLRGQVLSDKLSRGQYATDASVYQIMPQAVVLPESVEDVQAVIDYAQTQGIAVVPRGGGTSQNGQTINDAIVIDYSRHLNQIIELDVERRRCVVQSGMVLDSLNRQLKPHGLWFPVDVSTASRATIGGMCGNNSCGQRSIVYGTMRHNVRSLDAIGADGCIRHFGRWQHNGFANTAQPTDIAGPSALPSGWSAAPAPSAGFVDSLLGLGTRYEDEVRQKFPAVLRRVGGYNIDTLIAPATEPAKFQNALQADYADTSLNLSGLMVGSEGTLGCTTAVELTLAPLPGKRVLGVCHFPTFHSAMAAAQHLVKLKPTAVELVDATMIQLARDIEAFRPTLEQFVRANPAALLLVEFASESDEQNRQSLRQLTECMGDLGFSWAESGAREGGVVDVVDASLQSAIADVRSSGLNIMMSMKTEGKPVSFVEDCAVELQDLAAYTDGLTEIFEKHGTTGTWYAHASVGCLHVRPVLNLKLDKDLTAMREIAEEAFDLVLKYKGSNSGEHGDGISRSEFHEKMFGASLVQAFVEVKQLFDPDHRLNPGKIVNPPSMNDRQLLRYHANYQQASVPLHLDWSGWPQAGHAMQGAVEMCNNNGACRKLAGGAMCPSYRATRNETDVTRGRANALRLVLSGQLHSARGRDALASDELYESLKLCVSCKACKRECPTGVDMAKMKLEVMAARNAAGKHGLHEKLVAALPVYAHTLARLPAGSRMLNLSAKLAKAPLLGRLFEKFTGFTSSRSLPVFAAQPFDETKHLVKTVPSAMRSPAQNLSASAARATVILWVDTFNRYFEPQILEDAIHLLQRAGYTVVFPQTGSQRPLCCGRTWLSTGKLDEARRELQRTSNVLLSMLLDEPEAVVVGLEPSCLLTFRDELSSVLPGADSERLAARALLFEEFLVQELDKGRLDLEFNDAAGNVLVHGHCHQKAFGQMDSVMRLLQLVPGANVAMIESSCCGMAGSFGYQRESADVSKQMAELSLLPAVREALELDSLNSSSDTKSESHVIIADGTSCRHQISDYTAAAPLHVASWLNKHLA